MKLISVVITYYPDVAVTRNNILRYIDAVDYLIIWENTPAKDRLSYRIDIGDELSTKIVNLGTGKNEGIAYALNRSFEYAIDRGYEYVLTMDQDSLWKDFSGFKDKVEVMMSSDIAIYAPLIVNTRTDQTIRCNNTDFVITSGSIFNLSLYSKIGNFREDYIIDEVDNEYCVKSRKNGYRIAIVDESYLYQTFGSPQGNKGIKKYTSNYSSFRTFHQIRNRMWLWREYSSLLSYRYILRTLLYGVIRRTGLVLLVEKDKVDKLRAIYKGLFVGIFGKNAS